MTFTQGKTKLKMRKVLPGLNLEGSLEYKTILTVHPTVMRQVLPELI